MKILAFTDVHGRESKWKKIHKKAKSADLLLCAGDFTVFSDDLSKNLKRINSFGKKVLLIHGNHEEGTNIAKEIKKYKNIIYIHRKVHKIGEYSFIGYGGGGFSEKDGQMDKYLSKLKIEGKIVFVTHAPPYKTKLDLLWEHRGNKTITKWIKKLKPVLFVCGHFHENEGKEDTIKKSRLINPGNEGKIIEV